MNRLDDNFQQKWHESINAFNASEPGPIGHSSWMYEARTMADEVPRLTKLFAELRTSTFPQTHQQCSHQAPVAIVNELTCCLGVKCLECKQLLALDKMNGVSPEQIDVAKAWTCVGHIVSRGGDVMREGYVTSTSDRMFWDRTYQNMAGIVDNDTETDSI